MFFTRLTKLWPIMQNLSRLRLEFAAICFLAEMRRRFALSFPDQPNQKFQSISNDG